MKRRFVFAMIFCLIPVARAGTLDEVKVALHLEPRAFKNVCQDAPEHYACNIYGQTSRLNTQGDLTTAYDMYIVVLDIPQVPGLLGVELGLDYNGADGAGVDPFASYTCADMEFSGLGWPNAGGAVTYAWLECQNTADWTDPQIEAVTVAAAMYIVAYSDDRACVVPKPSGLYTATDCAFTISDLTVPFPMNSGCAGFGNEEGHDPCYTVETPVEETTWGGIKRAFAHDLQ